MRVALIIAFIFVMAMAAAARKIQPPRPPIAADIAVTTPMNTPIEIDLSHDSVGNPTSARVVGPVTGGTEMVTGALTVRFTPGMSFHGCGGFDFTLSNAHGTSNKGHVFIKVVADPAL